VRTPVVLLAKRDLRPLDHHRDAALTKLKRCLERVKVVQLFANTPKECSVIGRVTVVAAGGE